MLTVRSVVPSLDRVFSMNREFDRLFDEAVRGAAPSGWLPAADIVETDEAYVFALELPGVKPSDVEVSFEKQSLTVRGTKSPTRSAKENEELRIHAAERLHGAFERSIRLPSHVDGERISARFEHGVLEVTVPKKAAALPRKIEIAVESVEPAGAKQ